MTGGGVGAARWRRLVLALTATVFLLVGVGVGPASAHATLESTTPEQGTQLATAPTEVVVVLSEAVGLGSRSLQVTDARGRRVDDGQVGHPGDDDRAVRVALRPGQMGRGSYTVTWRVVSVDGHPVSGTFSFGVGVPAGAPPATSAADPVTSALRNLSQFASYAGAAVVLGGSLVLFWLWPAGAASDRLRRVLTVGVAVGGVGALGAFVVQGPYVAGRGVSALLDPELLAETATSPYGRPLLLRALAMALSVPTLGLWPRVPDDEDVGPGGIAAAGNLVLLAASFALTGHAAEATPRLLAEGADAVHVAAAGVWIGGLVVLAGAVLPEASPAQLEGLLRRWSRVAMACVGALVVTGAYQAWREVAAWGALTDTRYGRLILIKLGLVMLVLALAAGARSLIRRGAGAAGRLRAVVAGEAALGVAVLGVTSVLVATPPARSQYSPPFSTVVQARTVEGVAARVVIDVSPTRVGRQTVKLRLYAADGQDLAFTSVSGKLSQDGSSTGAVDVAFPASGGRGAVTGTLVAPASGVWRLTVQIVTGPATAYAGTTTYQVR